MNAGEIANELTWLAYRLDSMRRHQATTEGLKTTSILREAAAILRTHPDAEPNDPLTLEELKGIDGDPVWICTLEGDGGMWALVDLEYELCRTAKGGAAIFASYGRNWLAYRRRPEEKK